ncbi:MAG: phospholipid carrier-dependent glycosyltransferase [Bacteroidetes bacterium]|nr:MAG: phospholipid carrier-dependent glycosyltransferase [Bacteroidota bacterium]
MHLPEDRLAVRTKWVTLLLFAAAAYFPLFLHLGNEPVKNFDESLFACRAFSLAYFGEYLCNFTDFTDLSEGKIIGPGASNTKPPLISFVQAAFFRLFGYNELALRLPSALSAVLILLVFYRLSRRLFGSPVFGYLAGLVLVSSRGFVNVHVSRTGDHDAPLALFGIVLLLAYYHYLETERRDTRQLIIMTAMLSAAALTKGVAGLFFGPGMVLYALYKRQLIPILRDRRTWLAVAAYLGVVAGYYLYREWDCPGFLSRVWRYEVGGHYGATRDGHLHPWYWYFQNLYYKFTYFLPLLPLGIALFFVPKLRALRSLGVLLLLAAASWMAVISNSETKLLWYDASLYPILSLIVALALYQLHQALHVWLTLSDWRFRSLATGLFLLAFFALPYSFIISKVYHPKEVTYIPEQYGFLIKQTERNLPDLKNYHILHLGQSTHALFYQLVYDLTKDYQIGRYRSPESIQVGDVIMACQNQMKKRLFGFYDVEVLQAYENCVLVRVVAPKPPPQ